MKDFKNKTVVITGGSTGIGFALAKAFGAEGANLVIASRRAAVVERAVSQLWELGYEASGTTCDVSNPNDLENLANDVWERYGRADVLINNAGVSQPQAQVLDLELAQARRVFDINYFGVLHGIQVFGRRFREEGLPCAIYTVGSENSIFNGVPHLYSYISAKHALHGLMTALREEAPEHMDVSFILPGFVTSELTAAMEGGMPADKYAQIVLPQLKENRFYVVSHAYGVTRAEAVWDEIHESYRKYAPRHEGDHKLDVRSIAASSENPLI